MSASRQTEPSAVEVVEEAVHLLRRVPLGAFAIYYAGAVPFVVALLFFWAHTTWFLPSGAEIAWGSLGLTVLFVVMKALQSEFCAHLLAFRLGAPPPVWSWARVRRCAVAQLELQPWAFLATVIASLVALPLGWVYAYGQIATVIGDDEHLHRASVANARLWPATNHLALLLISGVAVCLWGNILAAFIAVPWLANRLLGIDNVFGWSGWNFGNSTFLAAVTALTWLVIDPIVKALYTLWVFYGRARRTGDDIRVELQRARPARVANALRVAALVILGLTAATGPRLRAESAPPPPAARPERLDQAIDRVLDKPEFSWRLRPVPRPPAETSAGPIKRFLLKGAKMVSDAFSWIGRKLRDAVDWLIRQLFPERATDARRAGGTAIGVLKFLLYAFIGGAILLILWVIWIVYRQVQRQGRAIVGGNAVVAAAPDLRDENIQAAQLPVDGWLAMAREQMARGEWRLALRALYLAMLARLAADGLISLARFKTNLDYERELRRRALSRLDLVGQFAIRRRTFESVWYGRERAGEKDVREWMAELERPTAP
jgi:hypothetical protein